MISVQNKRGFTLLELLVVIGIIAVLSMIVMGASTYISRVSRVKRVELSCKVLETAVQAYYAHYNEWPDDSKIGQWYSSDNDKIFGPLRVTSNDDGIAFFDESAFLAYKNGHVVPLVNAGAGKYPLVYIPRNGDTGSVHYYRVKITEAGDVTVDAPELKSGGLDDD